MSDILHQQQWLRRLPIRSFANILAWPFPGRRTAAAGLLLFALELLVPIYLGSSFWNNGGLTLPDKLALTAILMIVWVAVAWAGFWYLRLVRKASGRVQGNRLRRFLQFVVVAPIAIGAAGYLSCWIYFWRLGVFPDLDAFYFGALNADMLARYMWQAERTAFLFYLLSLAGLATASWVTALRVLGRSDLLDCRPTYAVFRQGILFWAGVNVVFLSPDDIGFGSPNDTAPLNRIEAGLRPWAPITFEFNSHVNPVITQLVSFKEGSGQELAGEIPLEAMTPIARIRPSSHPDIAPEQRRNIIFITIESLRNDAILASQQDQMVMPRLANLARTGHFFPNCYANSSHSDYSDPCILSSLFPLRSERAHYYRREDPWPKVLIYDLLKQYGYATAMFSSQNEAWSNMHLFYESPHLDEFFDSRAYKEDTIIERGYFAHWMSETGQIAGKLDDAVTTGRAVEWIEKQQRGQRPFFLSMNLQTSHFPYERPDGQVGPFLPATVPADATFTSYKKDDVEVIRNTYYNALRYVDLQIGRLIDSLKTLGLRERTIIVVTGDHGEAFYENEVMGHARMPLETVLKVGLVIHCDDFVKPAIDDYPVQAVDIVPTAIGLLDLPAHPAHQGTDVMSFDRPPRENRLVFVHCRNPAIDCDAVISGTGWKYIIDHQGEYAELFLRPTDLTQHANMMQDEPQVAGILNSVVADWRHRQLLYYGKPRYYGWFYPPEPPNLSSAERQLLERQATQSRDPTK